MKIEISGLLLAVANAGQRAARLLHRRSSRFFIVNVNTKSHGSQSSEDDSSIAQSSTGSKPVECGLLSTDGNPSYEKQRMRLKADLEADLELIRKKREMMREKRGAMGSIGDPVPYVEIVDATFVAKKLGARIGGVRPPKVKKYPT